ncbi:MAG: Diadenosine tetraphosphate hydrolase [Nitrosopumilales archaeon]|nr:MAG: Diadenosine tetraphosphate hydrolase [Nitrosopumilales archaeon]
MKEERSAGTILFIEESSGILFLLLHYPSGHWDFVKGKIENGETLLQTVLREVKEETGISDVQFVKGFEERIEYNYRRSDRLIHKQVIFFLAKTNTKKVKLSYEHIDFVWLNFDEAMKKVTYKNARHILQKANALVYKA